MCVDITRYGDALHLGAVLRIAKHLLGRHDASTHNILFVIDVVNEQIERLHALTQPLLQGLPFGSRDDARDDVKRNQPFSTRFAAIDREGDTNPAEHQIGFDTFTSDDVSGLFG